MNGHIIILEINYIGSLNLFSFKNLDLFVDSLGIINDPCQSLLINTALSVASLFR